jgi:hypothetical protein
MVVKYTYFFSSLLMQVGLKVTLILFSSPRVITLFAEFHNLFEGANFKLEVLLRCV